MISFKRTKKGLSAETIRPSPSLLCTLRRSVIKTKRENHRERPNKTKQKIVVAERLFSMQKNDKKVNVLYFVSQKVVFMVKWKRPEENKEGKERRAALPFSAVHARVYGALVDSNRKN